MHANTIPAGYPADAGSLNPSFAIRMYVMLTADIKVAGSAVIRLFFVPGSVFKKYAVAVHRLIIARVWLLQEK